MPRRCRRRRTRDLMHESPSAASGCSSPRILQCHTACRSRGTENDDGALFRHARSEWNRREFPRPATSPPATAPECCGTPWRCLALDGVAVQPAESLRQTAAGLRQQRIPESRSFAGCFVCARGSIQSPSCRVTGSAAIAGTERNPVGSLSDYNNNDIPLS